MLPPFSSFETPYSESPALNIEEQLGEPQLINTPILPGFSPDPRFNENLVRYIDRGELERIGNHLSESISGDDRDRQKWLRIIREGIEYLGLGAERAPSTQSSKDTDLYAATFLAECLKISCKLFCIFFPSRKFVDTKLYGELNAALEDQAYRTSEFFHYYTNEVMTDYIQSAEQAIWWSVLAGSAFVKPYYDPRKGRIVAPYIPPHEIIISSGASSLNEAERVTHRFTLNKRQMEDNFFSGMWIKGSGRVEENSNYSDPVTRKVNQVVGIDPLPNEDNQNYRFDECFTYLRIPGFEEIGPNGQPTPRELPFRVIKDANSNAIVGLWRNWNENDALFRPKIGIIQHRYFTGFTAYGLGMIHLALGLAKTETKIQQQLLKGAVLSNMPNLIQKAGLRTERSQLNFTPGVIPQVNTFGANLQDAFMPMPFSPPQPVMMDLKNACAADIQNISMARELKPEDMPANTSATAVLAMVGSSNDISNSLIKSYYRSFTQEFQMIYNLLGEILPDEPYPFNVPGGHQMLCRHDFAPSVKLRPTVDPSNSSQTQQVLTNEVVSQLAQANPDLYNQREIQKMVLKSLHVQDIEKVLNPDPDENPPPPPPPEIDPVSENMANRQNQPIKAYKDQDHAAHITVHKADITTLMQQQEEDQTIDNSSKIAALQAHNIEHEVFEYQLRISNAIGIDIPDDPSQVPPDVQKEIALRAAQSSQQQQEEQANSQPAAMDPSIPLMEENRVKEKGIELEAQSRHEQHMLEQMKLEKQDEIEHLKIQLEFKRLEIEERKLALQEKENENKTQVDLTKLHLEQQKADLQAETKAFGDTLKYESDAALKDREIEANRESNALEAKSKAFDTVMAHEREHDDSQQDTQAKGE